MSTCQRDLNSSLPPRNPGQSFSVDNLNASRVYSTGDLKNLIRARGSWSFQCPPSVPVLGLSAQLDTAMRISSSSTLTTHTISRGPAIFSLTNLIPLVLIPPVSHKHCWHANIFTLAQHVPSILSKYPVQLSNNRVQGLKKDFLNQNFHTCS